MIAPKRFLAGTLFIVSIIALIICSVSLDSSNFMLLHWVGMIIYVSCALTWSYRNDGKLLCPYNIFLTFYYIFNLGQCTMWAFGLSSPKIDLLVRYGPHGDISSRCINVYAV